jgi:hypothetical protein
MDSGTHERQRQIGTLDRAMQAARAQGRADLAAADLFTLLDNRDGGIEVMRAREYPFATHAPPGWQAAPPPASGQSLTALTPTRGRGVAAALALAALVVGLALVTLPPEDPSSGGFPAMAN